MTKKPTRVLPSTIRKCYGFVLHFGYVESAYPGPIIIHHARLGFATVRAGIMDLAQVFLHDFMNEYAVDLSTGGDDFDTFQSYLRTQPERMASAGPSFLTSQWNNESWWPWDSLRTMMPFAHGIYESEEPAENYLASFVNTFDEKLDAFPDLREGLIEYQKKPSKEENGGVALSSWKERSELTQFQPLKKAPKRRVHLKNRGEPDGAWG